MQNAFESGLNNANSPGPIFFTRESGHLLELAIRPPPTAVQTTGPGGDPSLQPSFPIRGGEPNRTGLTSRARLSGSINRAPFRPPLVPDFFLSAGF